jgi:hypothetical protein
MRVSKCVQALLLLLPLGLLAGCSGSTAGSGLGGGSGSQTASVFTMATDAPLPSVVSCQVQIDGVSLNGSPNLLSTPALIDFARWSGLHQLVDLNAVPVGTYTTATITLDATTPPVIQYIDTTVNPPAIHTLPGTSLSKTTVTVPLAKSFTLNANDLVGFRMEFDIAASLATNSGQLTGVVNPTFDVALLNAADAKVSIDDFRAGFVGTVNANTFTVQGPHGRQWTVTTNNNTDFDTAEQPSSYTANSIVEISGQLDPVTKSIDASEVAELSTDKFVLGGLFTSIRPPAPASATAADLYVRSELPDITGLAPGQITTLTLNGSENYKIANIKLPVITSLLFNNNSLTPGQHVAVGGVINTSNGTTTLIPHRVVLERQGQFGTVTTPPTITNGNVGSFQLVDNSPAGILLPSPLTVLTFNATKFINLSGLSAVTGKIRVVGFILFNNGAPVMVARSVEQLN